MCQRYNTVFVFRHLRCKKFTLQQEVYHILKHEKRPCIPDDLTLSFSNWFISTRKCTYHLVYVLWCMWIEYLSKGNYLPKDNNYVHNVLLVVWLRSRRKVLFVYSHQVQTRTSYGQLWLVTTQEPRFDRIPVRQQSRQSEWIQIWHTRPQGYWGGRYVETCKTAKII